MFDDGTILLYVSLFSSHLVIILVNHTENLIDKGLPVKWERRVLSMTGSYPELASIDSLLLQCYLTSAPQDARGFVIF